jgi:hypothetical protein
MFGISISQTRMLRRKLMKDAGNESAFIIVIIMYGSTFVVFRIARLSYLLLDEIAALTL